MLDDFLYVCDDAYIRDEYIKMEMDILKTVGFDIGMPSSYRFLRRYSKVGNLQFVGSRAKVSSDHYFRYDVNFVDHCCLFVYLLTVW